MVRLPYKPPYDWDAIVRFLTDRAIPGVERVEARRYARTLQIDGARGVVIVTPRDDGALQAEIHFSKLPALPAVIARIRRVFDLSADPTLIGAHLSLDPALAPLVAARPGLRAPGAWDGFELAVRAILGQQITVSAARGLAAKLVEKYGRPIDDPAAAALGLTRVFPTPERLIGEDIAALGMPRARGRRWRGLRARSPPIPPSSRRAPTWRAPSPRSRPCRAWVSGRRSTSPCANCASRTPFRKPTSV